MIFSLPFLATNAAQITPLSMDGPSAAEAILFDRAALAPESWLTVWDNIGQAVSRYGPSRVTFHFPVNDCDYCDDMFVRQRLTEAYQRASDLGLHGVVVHANRVRPIAEWQKMSVRDQQHIVIDVLSSIRARQDGTTFLALENMPLMDNYGREIDPSFCYPSDFGILEGTAIGIVWDFCHWASTVHYRQLIGTGNHHPQYYPNLKQDNVHDYQMLGDLLTHIHFSAFLGAAEPFRDAVCREGVLPQEGTAHEALYETFMMRVADLSCMRGSRPPHIVFEVQEVDYTQRMNGKAMIGWASRIFAAQQSACREMLYEPA